jgi:protein subunit release factor A
MFYYLQWLWGGGKQRFCDICGGEVANRALGSQTDKHVPRIEILSGAGGPEADRWVTDLSRILTQYARRKGWAIEEGDRTAGTAGGFSRVRLDVRGSEAYARLRLVQGTHRVQRESPESQGRIHTSTATVIVAPIDLVEERVRRQHDVAAEPTEKIRTYNFPQNRVTDHRVFVTLHGLDRLDAHLDYLADILDVISE